MDVRIQVGPEAASPDRPIEEEIATGLPDGTLRSLLDFLATRHPELEPLKNREEIDPDLVRLLVNNELVDHPHLADYLLKDGDTVRLVVRDDEPTSS